jgi:hypothetical protein
LEFLKWKELRQLKQEILLRAQKMVAVANARHLANQLVKHLAVLLTNSAKILATTNLKCF